jgi:hypothetical protein
MAKKLKGQAKRPEGVKGISNLVWVQAKHLRDARNPLNWRKHSKRQREGVLASVQENGWAGCVVYNETTGRMIDGHLRQDLDPEQWVPVLSGEFTEAQERRLLRDYDALSGLAEMDVDAFKRVDAMVQADLEATTELLDNANKEIFENLSLDLNDMAKGIMQGTYESSFLPPSPETQARQADSSFQADFAPGEATKFENTDFAGVVDLKDYEPFPSSNELGIPDLRADMLCDTLPTDTWAIGAAFPPRQTSLFIYGSNRIGGPNSPPECKGHCLCFFTDDERFEVTWNKLADVAKRFRSQGWAGIVSPDFSTWWNWPLVHKLWNIYRNRYITRYWQEVGIKIIPGLSRVGDVSKSAMEVAGIPKHCPIVSFQCRAGVSGKADEQAHERRIIIASTNNQMAILEPENVLIYGGAEHRSWLEPNLVKGPKYHYLEQWATVRQRTSDTFTKQDEPKTIRDKRA